jgi:hypothetical protein
MPLRIAHLYPDVMNVYGDRGNVIALRHRCEARGIDVEVVDVNVGDGFDAEAFDIVLIGGGQDREQERIAPDLLARGPALKEAFEQGLPALVVCGGFQLFGRSYLGAEGRPMPGIGLYDMETRHPGPATERCIGDVVMQTEFGEIVGFENHGGRTYLDPGQPALGAVVHGHGNNDEDGSEGARRFNTFGTYLHGSVLPKNPALADELIRLALQRRYGPGIELSPLDDGPEMAAHRSAAETAKRRDAKAQRGSSPGALLRRTRARLRDLAGR